MGKASGMELTAIAKKTAIPKASISMPQEHRAPTHGSELETGPWMGGKNTLLQLGWPCRTSACKSGSMWPAGVKGHASCYVSDTDRRSALYTSPSCPASQSAHLIIDDRGDEPRPCEARISCSSWYCSHARLQMASFGCECRVHRRCTCRP